MSFLKIFNCWAFPGISISELCCQVLAFEWLSSWILKVPRSHVLFHCYWVKKLENRKLTGLKEETLILRKHEHWCDSDMLRSLYLQEVYTGHPKQSIHSKVMKDRRRVWKNSGEWWLFLLMSEVIEVLCRAGCARWEGSGFGTFGPFISILCCCWGPSPQVSQVAMLRPQRLGSISWLFPTPCVRLTRLVPASPGLAWLTKLLVFDELNCSKTWSFGILLSGVICILTGCSWTPGLAQRNKLLMLEFPIGKSGRQIFFSDFCSSVSPEVVWMGIAYFFAFLISAASSVSFSSFSSFFCSSFSPVWVDSGIRSYAQ